MTGLTRHYFKVRGLLPGRKLLQTLQAIGVDPSAKLRPAAAEWVIDLGSSLGLPESGGLFFVKKSWPHFAAVCALVDDGQIGWPV